MPRRLGHCMRRFWTGSTRERVRLESMEAQFFTSAANRGSPLLLPEHYADELEALLDDAMLNDFNVEAEDGSPLQVAQSLVAVYHECFQGNYATVQRMQAQAAVGASRSQRAVVPRGEGDEEEDSSSDEGGEGEDEDEEMEDAEAAGPSHPPQPVGPVVDEDGFTLVQRPRPGRR